MYNISHDLLYTLIACVNDRGPGGLFPHRGYTGELSSRRRDVVNPLPSEQGARETSPEFFSDKT